MPTFDLTELRDFAHALDADLDRCDNGEGIQCETLDLRLRHYAKICCQFQERVRKWGREVFAGRVAFDPEAERLYTEKGVQLCARAQELITSAEEAEEDDELPCFVLDGKAALKSALWDLERLIFRWVRPKLSVGPSARLGVPADPAAMAKIREQLQSLPPLPSDWQPDDPRQRRRFRTLRRY